MFVSEKISEIVLPDATGMEEFEKGFHELMQRTGITAAYFIAGKDPADESKLEMRTGGDELQDHFLQIFMEYANVAPEE